MFYQHVRVCSKMYMEFATLATFKYAVWWGHLIQSGPPPSPPPARTAVSRCKLEPCPR